MCTWKSPSIKAGTELERYSEPGATVIERGHTLGLEVNCRKEEQWLVNSEDRRFKAMCLKERQGRRD